MPGLPALDFLNSLAAKQRTAEVILGGETVVIPRARLGLHLQLLLLEPTSPEDAFDYVVLATAQEPAPDEVAAAFTLLRELNEPICQPPLLRASRRGRSQPPAALRYRGRGIAAIVNEIATAYGWTADYILTELGPEEAWCYLQEIQLARHDERHFLYSLSTVGRDKKGKQKAFSGLPWLKISAGPDSGRPAPIPVPARFMPSGTIIRFERRAS